MGQKCKSILRIKGRKEEIHMGDIPDHITKGFQESRKSWKTWKSKEATFEVKVNLEWSARARESFLAWEFVHTLIVFAPSLSVHIAQHVLGPLGFKKIQAGKAWKSQGMFVKKK